MRVKIEVGTPLTEEEKKECEKCGDEDVCRKIAHPRLQIKAKVSRKAGRRLRVLLAAADLADQDVFIISLYEGIKIKKNKKKRGGKA